MKSHLIAIGLLCISLNRAEAQVQVSVNVNIDAQPAWGPTGYDHADFYYMPDIEAYYNVSQHQFVYLDGGRWIFAAALPERCRDYDLYRGYKVVINDPRPWLHHDVYRTRYLPYRNCQDRQPVLRDRRHDDNDGPGHGRGNGHAYGHDKDHGKHD